MQRRQLRQRRNEAAPGQWVLALHGMHLMHACWDVRQHGCHRALGICMAACMQAWVEDMRASRKFEQWIRKLQVGVAIR